MLDKDHVIATLKYCLEHGSMGGRDCWVHCDEKGNIKNSNARDKCPNKGCGTGCVVTPIREAIELLETKNPVKPKKKASNSGLTWWYGCGSCGTAIDPHDNYCRSCGLEVDWSD